MNKSSNFEKYTRNSKLKNHWVGQFLSIVSNLCVGTEAESVLDVGCGEGFVVESILEKKSLTRIVGIDISTEAIEVAQKMKLDASFLVGSAYELPFKDSEFDMVICTEVLEHLENPLVALKEVHRVSKKYAILSVPNEPFFMMGNLAVGKNWSRFGNDIEHINHWIWFLFMRFVQKNGFRVIKRVMPFPYIAFPWTILLCEKK